MDTALVQDLSGILDELASVYATIPFDVLLIGHSLCVAAMFRNLRDRYLLSYWASFAAAFAGGIISALLICDRHAAPVPLFAVNSVGVIWTACWWAINYFPGDIVHTLYASVLPIRMMCKLCLTILRVGLIVARVDLAVRLFPGVVAAPLVLGTVGGSGGKFCVDALMLASSGSEIAVPSFIWRSGLLCSAVYYLLVHVGDVFTISQGKSLLLTLFLAHSLVSDAVGAPLDFTEPLASALHVLLNVPRPSSIGGVAAHAKGRKAA